MTRNIKVGDRVKLPKNTEEMRAYLKRSVGLDSMMVQDMIKQRVVEVLRVDSRYVVTKHPYENSQVSYATFTWPKDVFKQAPRVLIRR